MTATTTIKNSTAPADRRFGRKWGEGYSNAAPDVVGFDAFTHDSGYNEDDRERINAMAVGAVLDLSDPSGEHIVTRVA